MIALAALTGGCIDWPHLSAGPVAHVTAGAAYSGDADVTVAVDTIIDTGTLAITPALSGALLDAASQTSDGVEVAVLRSQRLTIAAGITLRLVGGRPLVIIAGEAVDIEGLLDIGAHGITPGAGGAGPSQGPGGGTDGARATAPEQHVDAGGGGGGYGGGGGRGGDGVDDTGQVATISGATGGAASGDDVLTVLVGGSGGGSGGPDVCTRMPGGAGGGALQITSGAAIKIGVSGGINAGGGGGAGGASACNWATAGNGGGSGGAIVLQAPSVLVQGEVAASGGGGGSGGGFDQEIGNPGQDGQLGVAANGGMQTNAAAGGSGALRATAAGAGVSARYGGGGGGGVGRIRISSKGTTPDLSKISPAPSLATYP